MAFDAIKEEPNKSQVDGKLPVYYYVSSIRKRNSIREKVAKRSEPGCFRKREKGIFSLAPSSDLQYGTAAGAKRKKTKHRTILFYSFAAHVLSTVLACSGNVKKKKIIAEHHLSDLKRSRQIQKIRKKNIQTSNCKKKGRRANKLIQKKRKNVPFLL